MYSYLSHRGEMSLAYCAQDILGTDIQNGFHSPVEDAHATMLLYLNKRPFDRVAALAAHEASLPLNLVEDGNKLLLTTAAFTRPVLETHDYRGKGKGEEKGQQVPNMMKKKDETQTIQAFNADDIADFPALGAAPAGRKKRN